LIFYLKENQYFFYYTNLLNYTFASSTYSITQLTDDPNNVPNIRTSHKLYKFYIDEKDYKKLKSNDFFYLSGLKVDDSSKSVLNFFDKKFRFGTWIEFIDDYTNIDINIREALYAFSKR
jgi:hypothetical protein